VAIQSVTNVSLTIYDIARGTFTPLIGEGEAHWPVWTSDGQRVLFLWLTGEQPSLAMQAADGGAPSHVLMASGLSPSSLTPDGRHLAVVRDAGGIEIVTIEQGLGRMQPLIGTPTAAKFPEFSRDGHWLAYTSAVSGRVEVYVRPYPGPGPVETVSIDGGRDPAWHSSGRNCSS
jgi:Tol biopolymer transport system component